MRFKLVLSLVVILLLIGILMSTNFGQNYLGFLTKSAGKFSLPFNFNFGSFVNLFPPTGEQFSIILTSNKSPYYGITFSVQNATFLSRAICATNIRINDIYVDKADSQCNIYLYNARGKLEITPAGSMVIAVDTEGATIDSTELLGGMRVEVEIVPMEFTLVGINEGRIALDGVDGEFKRIETDGTIGQVNVLKNETITIYNFVGILQLEDSVMNLQGIAYSVESSTFKIPK